MAEDTLWEIEIRFLCVASSSAASVSLSSPSSHSNCVCLFTRCLWVSFGVASVLEGGSIITLTHWDRSNGSLLRLVVVVMEREEM